MSLARLHKERILASLTVASAPEVGSDHAPAASTSAAGATNASPEDRAAAQIVLRLTHDLRRLKEIKSIDKKIAAKREMLPEYRAWVEGVLAADAGIGAGIAAEVLPTVMVWRIDTGDYDGALDLVPFVLRHNVPMPSRYQRDAATIVVEEVADAAIKAQNAGETFSLDVLECVRELTSEHDLHDEVRAKLLKAIGVEWLRRAENMPAAESQLSLTATLEALREAQRLNDRVGVKDRIKRADKLLAAVLAAETKTEQGGEAPEQGAA